MTDWRADLAAARQPPTVEQQAWDRRWQPRFDRYVHGGKSPNESIGIADRLTEDQQGPRPKINKEET